MLITSALTVCSSRYVTPIFMRSKINWKMGLLPLLWGQVWQYARLFRGWNWPLKKSFPKKGLFKRDQGVIFAQKFPFWSLSCQSLVKFDEWTMEGCQSLVKRDGWTKKKRREQLQWSSTEVAHSFQNKQLWSLSSLLTFDKWLTDSENWQVMWQFVTCGFCLKCQR